MSSLRIKKLIREIVIERDNSICQLCGKQATQLHHIVYRSHSGDNTAYNLICLCDLCHRTVHDNGKKWFPILLEHQRKHYPNLTIEKMKRGKI